MSILAVNDLHASIGGSQILRGIGLEVPRDSVVCLMGRNGVGKTSTLKALLGLLPTEGGTVEFDGTDISRMKTVRRVRRGIGYVPQGRDIFPYLTVEENLMIGTVARGTKPGPELDRVFELFPVIRDFLGRKGGMLSGGQQQQLAIGRALLTKPKLLILDEPTEGIQPSIIDQIGDAIKSLVSEGGISILLVEQYLDFCKEFGHRFAILERGAVAASGEIKDLHDDIVQDLLTV